MGATCCNDGYIVQSSGINNKKKREKDDEESKGLLLDSDMDDEKLNTRDAEFIVKYRCVVPLYACA